MAKAATSINFGFDIADPSTWIPALFHVGTFAAGTGTPAEQVVANAIVIAGALSATTITTGATIFLVFLSLPFLAVGILRFIPIVDQIWPIGA